MEKKKIEMQNLNQMKAIEGKLAQMDQQIGLIEQQINEDQRVIENIKDLSDIKNSEIVFPLGGGIFATGEVKSLKKVLVSIGSGVVIKKDILDAKRILEKRKEKLVKAREILANQIRGIMYSMQNIEGKLEKLN